MNISDFRDYNLYTILMNKMLEMMALEIVKMANPRNLPYAATAKLAIMARINF